MATRKATEKEADDAFVVTLDDGTQIEFPTEAEAREEYPRAWVRAKSEIPDDDGEADE